MTYAQSSQTDGEVTRCAIKPMAAISDDSEIAAIGVSDKWVCAILQ